MDERKELLKDSVKGIVELVKQSRDILRGQKDLEKNIGKKLSDGESATKDVASEVRRTRDTLSKFKVNIPKRFDVDIKNDLTIKTPKWYEKPSVLKGVLEDMLTALGALRNTVLRTRVEQDRRDPKDYVNVRLSNGKDFYSASGASVLGGGGGVPFKTASGQTKEALIDNGSRQIVKSDFRWIPCDITLTVSSIQYFGYQDSDGAWMIAKHDKTSGDNMRFATVSNNSSYSDYTSAWTNRASLTYGLPAIAGI